MNVSWNQQTHHSHPTGQDHAQGARRELPQVALLLLLVLMVFFWPAVFGGRVLLPMDMIFEVDPLWQSLAPERYTRAANPALSDQVYMYLSWQTLASRALAQGQLPLWNPYIERGLPFVGNAQSAVFGLLHG
jgi:hypothetical protein